MTMSLQIKMATNHSCISRFHNPECSHLEMSKSNERSPIKQAVLIILKAPFTNIQRRHFGLELTFIPRKTSRCGALDRLLQMQCFGAELLGEECTVDPTAGKTTMKLEEPARSDFYIILHLIR